MSRHLNTHLFKRCRQILSIQIRDKPQSRRNILSRNSNINCILLRQSLPHVRLIRRYDSRNQSCDMRTRHARARHFLKPTKGFHGNHVHANAGVIHFPIGIRKWSYRHAILFGDSTNGNAFGEGCRVANFICQWITISFIPCCTDNNNSLCRCSLNSTLNPRTGRRSSQTHINDMTPILNRFQNGQSNRFRYIILTRHTKDSVVKQFGVRGHEMNRPCDVCSVIIFA
mmetsp:Transcript_22271/g.36870  ORF Transcript_22271/g.36870 Transcript_22271/m.36870 type:complete len:227 (+) Transcript_22271:283-963(+)